MRGHEGEGAATGAGLDIGAVGVGTLAGVVALTVLGLIQGMWGHISPFSPQAQAWSVHIVQGLAGVLAGLWSARRAQGVGWLHGALSGLGLALAVSVVMGVKDAFPDLMQFVQRTGILTGLGALGGVFGVNMGSGR